MNIKNVSIITIVYNRKNSIKNAIESVVSQNYPFIEYIVIDGGSTDGTTDLIKQYIDKISVFISEPDNGVYHALNKGIKRASGDVVAMLHADNVFYDNNVVTDMVRKMNTTGAEFCFADMVIIDNLTGKILRYYMAGYFKKWMFKIGLMPPHPTCFIKKSLFLEFGLYSTKYKLAGDFDFLVKIFYSRKIKAAYLSRICVKMSNVGISNAGWRSKQIITSEIKCSLAANNLLSLPFLVYLRFFMRLIELLARPRQSKYD